MNQHCPHCNEIIFHARKLDEHAFGADASDPVVYQSGVDWYADCPSCSQPVRMEPAPSETGLAYRVAHLGK